MDLHLNCLGLAVRVFANGPGDLGSIPGRVIPKTQKMVLDVSLLNTQHYRVLIKGKVEQSWEGVAPSPTPWCSSYRKGSLRVTLDYGRQLYFYLLTYAKLNCLKWSCFWHWNCNYAKLNCLIYGDTDYFEIVAGVLQGDTLATYLSIICLDYVLRTSIDNMKENGLS